MSRDACTLDDIDAEGATTFTLTAAAVSDSFAVHSSGYFSVAGRRMWAQYNTYVAVSDAIGDGLLVTHSVFVSAERRAQLRDDVAELSDAVQCAFLSATGDTVDDDVPTSPLPVMEVPRDGA